MITIGEQFTAECLNCQEKFSVRNGGGFHFFVLHCDTCGLEKEILEQDVRHYMASKKEPLHIKQEVEIFAGKCNGCQKGHYRLKSPARCPKCYSDQYKIAADSVIIHYD